MTKNIFNTQLTSKPQFVRLDVNIDFFEVFKLIEQNTNQSFLFESLGEHSNANRYSVIGFDPEHTIFAKGKSLTHDGQVIEVDNPYYYLRNFFPNKITDSEHFIGGLVGYIAYDAITYFEPSLSVKLHPDFDQFKFGFYTDGLVYDKLTGEMKYFYHAHNRIEKIKKIINKKSKKYSLTVKYVKDGLSKEDHKSAVSNIISEIKAGNTFQSQLGFKRHYQFTGDHIAVYEKLRTINPSPYMFYIKNEESTLMGSSPELLFKLHQKHMESFPLAGTVKRGKNEKEDQGFARQLLNDPKEVAEHNMLIDLHRNDIGRVAEFGTVRVQKLKDIKKFSHVQHISSEIVGTLKKGEDMFSALASNFPAGTLSGAPKIESMKIIDRIEQEPRGPYGGAVGYFGFDGNCSFCIPIRSLFISKDKGFIQASGGIVYDSKPELEYQEIQNKLRPLDQVLQSFKEEK